MIFKGVFFLRPQH